jgi:hypothetical protein
MSGAAGGPGGEPSSPHTPGAAPQHAHAPHARTPPPAPATGATAALCSAAYFGAVPAIEKALAEGAAVDAADEARCDAFVIDLPSFRHPFATRFIFVCAPAR